ncbi:hypothetical protein [Streptomyces sp. NPDC001966]
MPVTDHADALPPGGDDVCVQPQRVDARVVLLQVTPEKSGQGAGHVLQRGVVDVHRALGEVVDQEVPYRGAGDALPVNQGGRCQLSWQHHGLQPCRGVGAEDAEAREERVEEVLAVVAVGLVLADGVLQLDAVADGDVADGPAFGGHDPGDAVECVVAVVGSRVAGRRVLVLERRETVGVGDAADVRQQLRRALAQ